ncbi:rrp5 [Symbiodinium sp. KB8]|nr:rrp5 [Symbiodinium sp. KB8]
MNRQVKEQRCCCWRKWGPEEFAGFLACPVGFVLVQYVIFLARFASEAAGDLLNTVQLRNKVRAQLDPETLKQYWEAMLNAFGSIYSVPNYVLDHSESANWGLTSTDIAVNINTEPGVYYPRYEDYCSRHPVPPPRLTAWHEDSTSLMTLEASGPDFSGLCAGRSRIPIALIGEHGPVNLDHLSTARAALKEACGSDYQDSTVEVEEGHFFTYLWALEGTKEGDALRATLRISWEEPLCSGASRSQYLEAAPTASLLGQSQLPFQHFADSRSASRCFGAVVARKQIKSGLHAAVGSGHLLVRVSMCLLHAFAHVFGEEELPAFWPLVQALGADLLKQGRLSAAATISAQMLNYQSGIRPPYVPALSLHVAASAQYAPVSSDVLFFRFRLPGAPGFIRILQMLTAEGWLVGTELTFSDNFQHNSQKHVVNACLRLEALHAESVVPLSSPYFRTASTELRGCDRALRDDQVVVSLNVGGVLKAQIVGTTETSKTAANTSSHPFSPFAFQGKVFQPDRFDEDRRYWAQYTEWELWPHLIRFRSAREMLQLATMTQEEAFTVSSRMRQHHEELRRSSLRWWRLASLVLAVPALASHETSRDRAGIAVGGAVRFDTSHTPFSHPPAKPPSSFLLNFAYSLCLHDSEEKCRSLQAALESLSSSASADIETATARVRDLELELERWQGWAEEEVAKAQRDSAAQLSVEQRRVAELGQELPRVRERLAEAEAQLRAKDWEVERAKTEAAAKTAEMIQQMDIAHREHERQMAHYKVNVEAELRSAGSYAAELESKLSVREQELEQQLAAAWAKAAEREAQLETADQQLRTSRAREKQLESRLTELSKDAPRAAILQPADVNEVQSASSRAEWEAKLSLREQELERQCTSAASQLKDAHAKIADLEAQHVNSSRLSQQCAALATDLGAARRQVMDLEAQLLAAQRSAEARGEAEDRQIVAKAAELKADFEQRLSEEQRAAAEQMARLAAQLHAKSTETAELSTALAAARSDLEKLQPAFEEELSAEKAKTVKLQEALQAFAAKQVEVDSKEVQTTHLEEMYRVQAMLEALEANVYELAQKLEVQTWATVDAETRAEAENNQLRASETRCSDLWKENKELQLMVETVAEREKSNASSSEAHINALEEQLQQARADAREEVERTSARICALHGQVAKSSHEAADLEKRLKEESDKAKQLIQENADLQQQLYQAQCAAKEVADLQQRLQAAKVDLEQAGKEKEQAAELERRLREEKDKALDPALLQQEKDKVVQLERRLQEESGKAASLQKQLEEKSQALDPALLQQVKDKVVQLERCLQEESGKAASLQKQLEEKSQALDPALLQQEQDKVVQLERRLQEESGKAASLQKQLEEKSQALDPALLQHEKDKVVQLERRLQEETEKASSFQKQLEEQRKALDHALPQPEKAVEPSSQQGEDGQVAGLCTSPVFKVKVKLQANQACVQAQLDELAPRRTEDEAELWKPSAPKVPQTSMEQHESGPPPQPQQSNEDVQGPYAVLLQQEQSKVLVLEQQLQSEKEKVAELEKRLQQGNSQAPEACGRRHASPEDLGVSVLYLCSFVQELESQGLPASSSLQDAQAQIKQRIDDATRQGGEAAASYVSLLEGGEDTGPATHYLCCASTASLCDLVDALKSHCEDAGLQMGSTYVWLHSFSGNMRNTATASSQASRMRRIGRVWLLLPPCDIASFTGSSSCLSELKLATSLEKEGLEVRLLASPQQVQELGKVVSEGGCTPEWQSWAGLNLDQALHRRLRCWVGTLAEGWLRRKLLEGSLAEDSSPAWACDAVGWLLREVSLHQKAESLLQDGLQLALSGDRSALLSSPGTGPGRRCTELRQSYEATRRAHEQMGTLETSTGIQLLESIGAVRWSAGDATGAADALQEALRIRRVNRSIESAEGAMLLRNLGIILRMRGDLDGGLEALAEAKRIRECTGSLFGADGVVLLLNLAFARADRGDHKSALEAFEEATTLLGAGSACSCESHEDEALPEPLENTPCGASLFAAIGVSRGNCGNQAGALSAYKHAELIRQRTKTLRTPAGAVLCRNQGVALLALDDAKASLKKFLQSKEIREQTGCLVGPAGANLLGSLAWSRVQCGDLGKSIEDCLEAHDLHKKAGTLHTPGGRAAGC